MKWPYILFIFCLTTISATVYSQEKGYYSIGNNRDKLHMKMDAQQEDSFVRAEKGYYSIKANRKKLKKSLASNDSGYRRIPPVTKGYYSIGNNSEKLRR